MEEVTFQTWHHMATPAAYDALGATPVSIPHAHPTHAHRQWYMAAVTSKPGEYIFLSAGSVHCVIRTALEGWTQADADSFNAWLQGWEPGGVAGELHVKRGI